MKARLLFFLLLISFNFSFAQKFMHGAGLGASINFGSQINKSIPSILTYSPRLNIVDRENMSVSAGVPLSFGFGSDYNLNYENGSADVSNTTTFVVNVPLMFNINLGAGATKSATKRVGFFAGAGFAYQYGSYASQYYDYDNNEYLKFNTETLGPAANIGMRFAVGKKQKNIEGRFSYMGSITAYKISAIGIAALFNF